MVSVAHEFSIDLANAAALREESDEAPDEDIPDTGVLAQFLERVSLVADADEIPEHGAGVVTMMTLHTAKGLEFPVVFVTGWEDGMFPHMRALGDPTELSEERRLAYVGITRARQRLYLSRAKVRSSWGQPMLNPESRFLREIPQELIDWRRVEAPLRRSRAGRAERAGSARPRPSPARRLARQAPADHARAGRSRHPRQVRARPGRGGVRRGRVRDVAHRLRQRGTREADAQPRAGAEALSGRPSAPVAGSSGEHDRWRCGSTGMRVDDRRQLRARDEQARRRSSARLTAPTTISTRPIRRRSSSAISPPMVAAADTAVRNPIATQNNRSVRHQPAISDVAMTRGGPAAEDADGRGDRRCHRARSRPPRAPDRHRRGRGM